MHALICDILSYMHPILMISVPDVRWVDWEALEEAGFGGVVFDKDNTITAPYQLTLWPLLTESFGRCRGVFDGRVAVLSNSAGLYEYDPDGSQARAIEDSIQGVHVIRHGCCSTRSLSCHVL